MVEQVKKKLPPHAVTCIRAAIVDCIKRMDAHELSFLAFDNRFDCFDKQELLQDYMCAVNVYETGYTTGEAINITLKDKSVVKAKKSTLNLSIECYAMGCEATMDTAYSVMAYISGKLQSEVEPKEFFAKRIIERGGNTNNSAEYSQEFSRLELNFTVEFNFVPSRPTLVFRRN